MTHMDIDRRSFLSSLGVSAGALVLPGIRAAQAELSRDLRLQVFVNHRGYPDTGAKSCAVPGTERTAFQVIDATTGNVAHEARLEPKNGDFSTFSVGHFDSVQKPGTYYVRAGDRRSYPFRVEGAPYDDILRKIMHYFATQRCGNSSTGYCSPCHLDDGIRKDNGEHQDVTGGWHDASDLRKWVGPTLYGVMGLSRVALLSGPDWHRDRLMDEILWGNQYFLKMQEPEGYVMSHIGGDVLQHSDSNRWTNNKIESGGDELVTIKPPEDPDAPEMTVYKPADDRVIETDPLGTYGQYHFVQAEALVARLARGRDDAYADRCRRAAEKAWKWTEENRGAAAEGDSGNGSETTHQAFSSPTAAGHSGSAILAAVELFHATGKKRYRERAVQYARHLDELQVDRQVGEDPSITGFFLEYEDGDEAHRQIYRTRTPFLGLCALAAAFPNHPDAGRWKDCIDKHARGYLLPLARQNCFGMVPLGLYADKDPAGRRVGPYWYRYFMRPEGWWVGVNAHVAAGGIGLLQAAHLLQNSELREVAQRQLDWILGFNPLHSSTVVDAGHNHPGRFVNSNEFEPPTPKIPGAVMNGLGGTEKDQPVRGDGWYHTAEYWTPMVGHTAWLMAALKAGRSF